MEKKSMVKSILSYWNRPEHAGYLFILPDFLILFAFTLVPLAASFALSACNLSVFLNDLKFIGFENFKKTFSDTRIWNALGNTLVYVVFTLTLQISIALVLAVWLYRNVRFNRIMRSVFYIPVLCSFTAIGIVFAMMVNSTYGYIPWIVTLITHAAPPSILGKASTAMALIVFIGVWKRFGHSLIILVAGINDIPTTLFEASEIDGASRFQQFRYITFPMLLPSLSFTLITNFITSMQVYDVVFVTTGGGPKYQTETIVQYIYSRGFASEYQLGYASAISVELFVLIATLVFILQGLADRKIEKTL